MNTLLDTFMERGLLEEGATLTAGLDHYKLTMSQLQYEKHPDAIVTFTFKNRDADRRLADYVGVEELQQRLDQLRARSWTEEELEYFGTIENTDGSKLLSGEYLDYLRENQLPPVEVSYDQEADDIAIETTGNWPLVTFWETVVMSTVNETYFNNYIRDNDLDTDEVYTEGARRLEEQIALLKTRPDFKFMDFGTRRHFSYRWHKYVTERMYEECPENITSVSNLAIARTLGVKPAGTWAHEMPMVYAALKDAEGQNPLLGHNEFLRDWIARYPEYDIALTDTFTSDFFFADLTPEQAEEWGKLRQDSGNPNTLTDKALRFYRGLGIVGMDKTVIYSDGLNFEKGIALKDAYEGETNTGAGIGTFFTNNMGIKLDLDIKPLNIVMKATKVRKAAGAPVVYTVKLSDDEGKHTGPQEYVDRYKRLVGEYVAEHKVKLAGVVAVGAA